MAISLGVAIPMHVMRRDVSKKFQLKKVSKTSVRICDICEKKVFEKCSQISRMYTEVFCGSITTPKKVRHLCGSVTSVRKKYLRSAHRFTDVYESYD